MSMNVLDETHIALLPALRWVRSEFECDGDLCVSDKCLVSELSRDGKVVIGIITIASIVSDKYKRIFRPTLVRMGYELTGRSVPVPDAKYISDIEQSKSRHIPGIDFLVELSEIDLWRERILQGASVFSNKLGYQIDIESNYFSESLTIKMVSGSVVCFGLIDVFRLINDVTSRR